MPAETPLELTEEQVLWYRARRQYLAGPGARNAAEAARAVVGVQAQQVGPAFMGLSMRTASCPTAEELAAAITRAQTPLVHTWGQRDTLHLFHAESDWADIVAAREQWAPGRRRGPLPDKDVLDAAAAVVNAAGQTVTKAAVVHLIPEYYIASVAELAERARMTPERFAATRVMWCLANRGDLALAGKDGAERLYAARSHWFPQIPWPHPHDPTQAGARLARRYLAAYGPATPNDIAHFFNARMGSVKTWLKVLEKELTPIRCGDRKNLTAPAQDLDMLREQPPDGAEWPLRLLPLWEGLVIAHKDKSWIIPDGPGRKQVWRPGAYVTAAILARGRIVATWAYKPRRNRLSVTVKPLDGWKPAMRKATESEARKVAIHLGLPEAEITID
ncbi:MAG: crosslink repair DNA glycosylase YcaQ family protein [Acidobacteriota bacterium]|nr:crosslink repair DNA glycosylase YcaQ family protein [Acidobacteriota bacterium]